MKLCTLPINPVDLHSEGTWVCHWCSKQDDKNVINITKSQIEGLAECAIILITLCIKVMQSSAPAVRYRHAY